MKSTRKLSRSSCLGFWLLVALLAFTNIFKNYWNPPETIWDETFHIPAAAKYIEGIFFMEPHPPLGKLLIAAGELLTRPLTGQNSTFGLANLEEAAGHVPRDFNPFGYRFFPVLFAILNTFLFAAILIHIFKSYLAALALLPLYVFENSIIAHSRAAMIDSFLYFGVLLNILAFLKLLDLDPIQRKGEFWVWSLIMALALSFATLTKAFGWALLILWPLLYFLRISQGSKGKQLLYFKSLLAQLGICIVLFHVIWALHFGIARTVNPEGPNRGFYGASAELQEVLSGQRIANPVTQFYLQLRDHNKYFWEYEKSVVPLDFKKGDAAGSYPHMWPLGSRPVSYLQNEQSQGAELLLAAIPNPINWLVAFLGLIIIPGLLISQKLGAKIFAPSDFLAITSLYFLYLSFYLPLFFIRRILYLNHYFTPLLISFLLVAYLMRSFYQQSSLKLRPSLRVGLGAYAVMSILSFQVFKPFTYFSELSCQEVNRRLFIRFWDMSHPACDHPGVHKKVLFDTKLED